MNKNWLLITAPLLFIVIGVIIYAVSMYTKGTAPGDRAMVKLSQSTGNKTGGFGDAGGGEVESTIADLSSLLESTVDDGGANELKQLEQAASGL